MWAAYTDECAAAQVPLEGAEPVLSFELEGTFDAQAFDSSFRALRARCDRGIISLAETLAYDADATVEEAFEVVRASLREEEPCFVLFRTATWTLWTWAPPEAATSETYLAVRARLRRELGGSARIPQSIVWRAPGDVVLDRSVVDAPPLGYDAIMPVAGARDPGPSSREQPPEVAPEPREVVPEPRAVRYAI